MITRRNLILGGIVAGGSLGLAPAFFRSIRPRATAPAPTAPASPYGPLGPPDANGIRLPEGFSSRVLAQANLPVGSTGYALPIFPDGSATFATPDGGWILVVNSEVQQEGAGGASGIRFSADGEIVDAYRVLEGTRGNCAGGPTPWGTWMSAEEHDDGQVWDCDPTGERGAVPYPAMGIFNHEAVAVDPVGQRLYLTEDDNDGGLYRFTPEAYPDCSRGRLEVAVVRRDRSVRWARIPEPRGGSANPTREQVPEMTRFKRGEGIYFDDGIVYVATTADSVVHAYDTRTQRISRVYEKSAVADPPLINPDNIVVSGAGEIFVAEDDGEEDPLDLCVITPDGEVARFLKLTGIQHGIGGDAMSEVTGPCFDPAGTRLYFSSQRAFGTGLVYEVTGPFRTQRLVGTPAAAPPEGTLGLEVPRRLSRAVALRRGIPAAFTIDGSAAVEIRVVARGARGRSVVIARRAEREQKGAERERLQLNRRGRELLRGRSSPLAAVVEVRIGSRTTRRRLRIG